MSLKQRLRALSGRQWLAIFAASIVLSLVGRFLARELSPFAIDPLARLALDAFALTARVLPALVVGVAVGAGALTLPRKRHP